METTKTNKTNNWIIVVLVVLNIFTLLFIWTNYKRADDREFLHESRFQRAQEDRYFRDRLGVTEKQLEEMRKLRFDHDEKMHSFQIQIHNVKMDLIDEIARKNSDSVKIDEYTHVLGNFHLQVEKEIAHHFRELKQVLDTNQIDEFRKMYMDALDAKRPDRHGPQRKYHNKHDQRKMMHN